MARGGRGRRRGRAHDQAHNQAHQQTNKQTHNQTHDQAHDQGGHAQSTHNQGTPDQGAAMQCEPVAVQAAPHAGRFSAVAANASRDPASPEMRAYTARRTNLEQFVAQHYGLTVRDDSALAHKFAAADPALELMWQDLTVVAHELACIQILHDFTPYDAVCQSTLKTIAAALAEAGVPWGDAWRRARTFGVPLVKLAALMSCDARIPPLVEWTDADGVGGGEEMLCSRSQVWAR